MCLEEGQLRCQDELEILDLVRRMSESPANGPVSDARAKAEARRAKILAREKSKKVTAIGDAAESLPVQGKKIERPLAARRSYVKSVSEKAVSADDSGEAGEAESTPKKEAEPNAADPEDDSITEFVEKTASSKKGNVKSNEEPSSNSSSNSKSPMSSLPPKKSIKEIEEEIARNTAIFDAKTLEGDKNLGGNSVSADDTKVDSSGASNRNQKQQEEEEEEEGKGEGGGETASSTISSKSSSGIRRRKKDEGRDDSSKKGGDEATKKKKEQLVMKMKMKAATSNIQPGNITRFIRVFVIIALGAYKGYSVVQNKRNQILTDAATLQAMESSRRASSSIEMIDPADAGADFGEAQFVPPQQQLLEQQKSQDDIEQQQRTWGGWLVSCFTSQLDSTLTAVSIAYWIAHLLSVPVTSRMKVAAAPPPGIVSRIMTLFQDGFESIFEYGYCMLGEYALHLGAILVVVTAMTLFTDTPMPAHLAGNASPPPDFMGNLKSMTMATTAATTAAYAAFSAALVEAMAAASSTGTPVPTTGTTTTTTTTTATTTAATTATTTTRDTGVHTDGGATHGMSSTASTSTSTSTSNKQQSPTEKAEL